MSRAATSPSLNSILGGTRRGVVDRFGDRGLYVITLAAALGSTVVAGGLVYKVFSEAWTAIHTFGLGFLTTGNWDPVHAHFGASEFIFGTAVSSFGALLIATPLSIAIALFLTELSPRRARTPIGILVELLAAIPSVILGLWGILVLGPVLQRTVEPALHSAFHSIPVIGNLFGRDYSIVGLFPAILILTIMTVPIVSSLTREIFATVPSGTKEAALALGATRWEMIKTTILPYSRSGIIAAVILGLGRAVGEAIAVTQVIGGTEGIHSNIFLPADTLASRIAGQYQGATSPLQISSIAYLGAILLVLSVIFNGVARLLVRRAQGGVGRRG
ncbi:MAG: phosphate ABC transporter permease subunit PstC [Actinomycetota bacterium]|nr:phosphate ABC transporter permease subunit PstC [Actinomycetota bacterium]